MKEKIKAFLISHGHMDIEWYQPMHSYRFWLIDAWWQQGRREEAREAFIDALAHRNRYGLLSEDVDPKTGALFGNFPQTYSMAGLILTGMKLSRNWEDRYWRS